MRIAVLGAGAMGSLFGARLALAGHDVQLLDVNAAHLDAIASKGLRHDVDGEPHVVRVHACRPEAAEGPVDLVMVFTKTFHTDAALDAASSLLAAPALVLTLQNGLGKAERIGTFVPRERIIVGMTTVPAEFVAPGHVATHGASKTAIMSADGVPRPEVDAVGAALRSAGFDCEVDPQVERAIWEKVAFNAAMNAILGVSRTTPGVLGACPEALHLARAVAAEACAVARAAGVEADVDAVHATMEMACREHAAHQPSMLQDLLAGKHTEVDALNRAVVEQAREHGLDAPLNETLWRLVKLAEARGAG